MPPAGLPSHTRWRRVSVRAPATATVLALTTLGMCVPQALASTLRGRVSSGGAAVRGAFVSAIGSRGHAVAVTGANGTFRLDVPDGTYRLGSDAPGFGAASVDVVVRGATTENVTLPPSSASLRPVPIFGGS